MLQVNRRRGQSDRDGLELDDEVERNMAEVKNRRGVDIREAAPVC
jgi:hypothetical protein